MNKDTLAALIERVKAGAWLRHAASVNAERHRPVFDAAALRARMESER